MTTIVLVRERQNVVVTERVRDKEMPISVLSPVISSVQERDVIHLEDFVYQTIFILLEKFYNLFFHILINIRTHIYIHIPTYNNNIDIILLTILYQ